MQRMASTLALSGWLGFSATTASLILLRTVAPSGGPGVLANLTRELSALDSLPPFAPLEAICFAAFLLGVAVVLAMAVGAFQRANRSMDRSAEALAGAGLTALFVFQGVAGLAGSPVANLFGQGSAFLLCLVAALAALLFDHLTATYAEDDDDAFEAALRELRRWEEGQAPSVRESLDRRRNER